MPLTAKLDKTSKRRNSTYQVTPMTQITASIVLKDSTDVVHPTFDFNLGATWNPAGLGYNYITVPELARKYFVEKWRFINGIWECDCTCDVLGTYKDPLLNEEKYVVRCGQKVNSNGYIVDGTYPITDETQHSFVGKDLSWNRTFATGWYVVGIVGDAATVNAGSVNYWVLSASELQSLVNYMLSGLGTTDWSDSSTWGQEWQRLMADPFQYIVSCVFFPVQPPISSAVYNICFGYWLTNITGHLLAKPYDTFKYYLDVWTGSIDAFGATNASNAPEYWYAAPYSSYALQFNPFGTIELDGTLALKQKVIGVEMKVDFINGTAFSNIYVHDNTATPDTFSRSSIFLTTRDAQVGVQIQLSQNTSSMIQTVANVGGNAVSGIVNTFSGNFSGALQNLGNILSTGNTSPLNGSFEHTGTNGGISQDEGYLMLHVYRRLPAQFYPLELGYPCCKPFVLTNCAGYTVLADGETHIVCTAEEREMLADYLTSGFFIE